MTGLMVLIVVLVIGFALWTSGVGPSSNSPRMTGGSGGTGDGDGAEGLEVQSVTDALPLRQRAAADRKAATKYRDEMLQQLQELESKASTMDKEQLALQRAEIRRELEWVEGRLHALPEAQPATQGKKRRW